MARLDLSRRLVLAVSIWALPSMGVAECTTNVCIPDFCPAGFSAPCCTIAGTRILDDGCSLNFGSQSVTIVGSSILRAATAGGSFQITAQALLLQGKLEAPGGTIGVTPTIGINVNGSFTTQSVSGSPGSIDLTANGPLESGSLFVNAGGAVVLQGGDITADQGTSSGGGILSISGASITATSRLRATGFDGYAGGDITLHALNGDVSLAGEVSANCSGEDGSAGTVSVFASGSITATANLETRGSAGTSGGSIDLQAGGNITVTRSLLASGGGLDADGGEISIVGGRTSAIMLDQTLDVRSLSAFGFNDGTISIGPACTVKVSGTLNARNPALSGGNNSIDYYGSLDASGANISADDDGGNSIFCRCIDANFDGSCDMPLQCVTGPLLTGATIVPVAAILPQIGPACTCGNGMLDAGEQCDDGNTANGDCCSTLCIFEPNGSPCPDDGSTCTLDQCDGAGQCTHPASMIPPVCTATPTRTGTPTSTPTYSPTPNTPPPAQSYTPTVTPTVTVTSSATVSPSSTPTPTETPTTPLESFLCFSARIASGATPFTPQLGLSLESAYRSVDTDVTRPVGVCNAASVNGASPQAPLNLDHLRLYQHKPSEGTPPFPPVTTQEVTNQFGTLTVDVVRPTRLLVPHWQSFITQPPQPTDPRVDHFDCFSVRTSRGTPKFTSIVGTSIQDQFLNMNFDVLKPTRLCAPANFADGQPGAAEHAEYLMCYKVRASSGAPKFVPITSLFVTDELVATKVNVLKPAELCVPSTIAP